MIASVAAKLPTMDDAEFEHGLAGITALSFSQPRRAWEGLAISEASRNNDADGPAGACSDVTCCQRDLGSASGTSRRAIEHTTNPQSEPMPWPHSDNAGSTGKVARITTIFPLYGGAGRVLYRATAAKPAGAGS